MPTSTDNERRNEPTLFEIYVSSKCETNSAFLLNNCLLPSPSLSFPLHPQLRIWSSNADQTARRGLIQERREREREEEKSKYSLPPSFLPPSFVSRFGTVPIYLSIFCAMHFSAKLTPSFSAASTSPFSPSFRCFYAHFPSIYLAALVDTRAFFMNPTSAAPPPLSSVINLI